MFLYLVVIPYTAFSEQGKKMVFESDFLAYYTAGKIANSNNKLLIYNAQTMFNYQKQYRNGQGVRPYLNPPIVLVPFLFLSKFNLDTAFALFYLINVAALLGCILLINKIKKINEKQLFILLTFPPVIMILILGQISLLLTLAITASIYFLKNKRYYLAGLTLGLILAKFQFSVIILLFLIISSNKIKVCLGLFTTVITFYILNSLLFVPSLFKIYINYLKTFPPDFTYKNTLGVMSLKIFDIPSIYLQMTALIILLFIAAYLWKIKSKLTIESALYTALLFGILIPTYSYIYDAVLLLPIIGYLTTRNGYKNNFVFWSVYVGITLLQLFDLTWISFLLLFFVSGVFVNQEVTLNNSHEKAI